MTSLARRAASSMSCSRTAADDPGDPRGTGGCTRGTGACTKPFPSAVLSHAYGAPRRGDEHCSLAALRTGTFRQRPRWSCPASYRSSDHSPKGGFPPERAEGSSGSPTRSARLWRENSVSSSASLTDRDLRALVGLLDDGRRDDAGPAMPKNCGSVRPAHRPMRPRWRVFGPQGASSTSSMGTSIALAARLALAAPRGGLPGTPSAAYQGRPG